MDLHNQELQVQLDSLIAVIRIAKDELQVAYDAHMKNDYDSQCEFEQVDESFEEEFEAIEKAMEIATDWAIRLDQSISTNNF